MPKINDDSLTTFFRNVDLDIYSKHDLQPLIDGFGKKVFVLYSGKRGRKYEAHLEVAGGRQTPTPDSTIQAFCKLIRALPISARDAWDSAALRSFSIGVQSGQEPNPADFTLRQTTVKAMSDLNAEVVLTIYALKNDCPPRRPHGA